MGIDGTVRERAEPANLQDFAAWMGDWKFGRSGGAGLVREAVRREVEIVGHQGGPMRSADSLEEISSRERGAPADGFGGRGFLFLEKR